MDELYGKTEGHLIEIPKTDKLIHRNVLLDYLNLVELANKEGFNIQIASCFRSYKRQLHIWNSKASGMREILDAEGNPIDHKSLNEKELLFAILKWSAIPGFSRHHWGTDIDIYDKNALPSHDYQVQLIPDEVNDNGIFGPMHMWLDEIILSKRTEFYRPYQNDLSGIAPERWHLSHKPTADQFAKMLSLDLFINEITYSDVMLKEEIINNAEEIFFKYIICP